MSSPDLFEEDKPQFDLSPVSTARNPLIISIVGEKDAGKTIVAFQLPGTIAVLSFDHKSAPIWMHYYDKDERVTVYNALKYYERSDHRATKTAHIDHQFILAVIESMPEVDWGMVDGTEIAHEICEMKMRYKHGLDPAQGFKERTWWKERRLNLRAIHDALMKKVKKGIIYTFYTEVDEILSDGNVTERRRIPKWIDVVKTETDVTIKVWHQESDDTYWMKVAASKYPHVIKAGHLREMTIKDEGIPNPFEGTELGVYTVEEGAEMVAKRVFGHPPASVAKGLETVAELTTDDSDKPRFGGIGGTDASKDAKTPVESGDDWFD